MNLSESLDAVYNLGRVKGHLIIQGSREEVERIDKVLTYVKRWQMEGCK